MTIYFPKLLCLACTWHAPQELCQHKLLLHGWDACVLSGGAVQLIKPLLWHPLLQDFSYCSAVVWIEAKEHKGEVFADLLIS